MQTPTSQIPVTERSGVASSSWFYFFADVAKWITGASQIAPITTPDASDPTTTQALANANKAKINEILAALKQ